MTRRGEAIHFIIIWRSRVIAQARFVPWLDMCCDVLGSNSLAPYYYSAAQDSLRQDLAGAEVLCNPPYKCSAAFIRKCEEACEENRATQVILVVPQTKGAEFGQFVQADRWELLIRYEYGARSLFSTAEDKQPFPMSRKAMARSVQDILACQFRRGAHPETLGEQLRIYEEAAVLLGKREYSQVKRQRQMHMQQ